jgi:isoleucyl-tRNA synthetase
LLLDQILHDYPFCWRADQDPLIQYPRESWFIRTTQFRDRMLANNAQIGWLPDNIRDGRFGNFLQSNVDWALSRERYWGTPLPIWECEKSGQREAVGSYDELLSKPGLTGTERWEQAQRANPELPEDLKVHKPYIDAVTYASPFAKDARMRRVPEVIDCWYDSGAMPFAQWGYPHRPNAGLVLQPIGHQHHALRPADSSPSIQKLYRTRTDVGRMVRKQRWQTALPDRRRSPSSFGCQLCLENGQDVQAAAQLSQSARNF